MARSPKSDPQREEVYRWEKKCGTLWYLHGMKMGEARSLLRLMCKRYLVPTPRFKTVEDAPYTAAAHGDVLVEVNRQRAKPTALLVAHEAAHIICHNLAVDEPDHGPTWLGVYIDLLDHFKILPRCMTEPSARKAKLKFKRNVWPIG